MNSETFLDQLRRERLDEISEPATIKPLPAGNYESMPDRRISADTCKLYDYSQGSYQGKPAHFAMVRDHKGNVAGCHVRKLPKTFAWVNKPKKTQLFGQHLGSNNHLIICEGQIDAMSVYEAQRGFDPSIIVVSTTSGVGNAINDLKDNLSYIQSFGRVTLMFDQDQAGRDGVTKAAELLGACARVRVVTGLPYKDANEALVAGDVKAIRNAISCASAFVPDGVVEASDLAEQILNPVHDQGISLPWEGWNNFTEGFKPGEVWLLSAGTGTGKSLFARSLCLHLCRLGIKCSFIGLEEAATTTLERMLAEYLGWPVHLASKQDRQLKENSIRDGMKAFAPNLMLLDKFGSLDGLDGFSKYVRHYVMNEEVKVVFLDHFSLLADGIAISLDQRRSIDKAIKEIKELAVELKFTFVVVSHLSRPAGLGNSDEEGSGEKGPELRQLRGSHSLAQYPDYIVMLQRNVLDTVHPNTTSCWLKKNRVTGQCGLMNKLTFDPETCRFTEEYGARGSI